MNAPLFSTFSLITELLVSTAIFYIFYKGYKHNVYSTKLAAVTILYELIFNISYMAKRTPTATSATSSPATPLAIVHGILSLIMFVSLIVFFIVAWNKYKKGQNFFKDHKILTIVFLFFWTVSVLSGATFYILRYIINI